MSPGEARDERRGGGRVADLLRRHRPGAAIDEAAFLGEGDFCVAYLVDGREVVRVPKHAEAAAALRREACLLPRIAASLPAAVPLPRFLGGVHEWDASLAVHERVPGTELTRGRWLSLPADARSATARAVGRFLRALHALDVDLAGSCGIETIDHHAEAVRLLAVVGGPQGNLLPGSLRRSAKTCLRRYVAEPDAWSYASAILNGDLSPGHVLVDPEGRQITGVIDWGDARIGDPARDFIFLFEDWGTEFLGEALEAYAPEPSDALRPRIHLQHVMSQLEWTLEAGTDGRADLDEGIRGLDEAIAELKRWWR